MPESPIDYLRDVTLKNTPKFPFDIIETKISLLMMVVDVVNKHPEEFPKELITSLTNKGASIGNFLSFYIVQEIQDFYRQAKLKFGDEISFPESAVLIKKVRDEVIAHVHLESSQEMAEICILLQEKFGSDKIYTDWIEFKDDLYKKLGEENER